MEEGAPQQLTPPQQSADAPSLFESIANAKTAAEVEPLLAGVSKEKLNELDSNGQSLLSIASVRGAADVVQLLLRMGCDPNVVSPGGVAPLHLATKLRHTEVVRALCEGGADPHQPMDNGPSALSMALGSSYADGYGVLATHFIAAHEGNDRLLSEFEVVRAAIAKGSAVFLKELLEKYGVVVKVTERAVAYCAREGNGDVMEILLKHGGSCNAVERGQHQIPAFVLAAALGNASCLDAMLKSQTETDKIDVEQDCLGLTALMHAAKEGHKDCVETLLRHGAKVDTVRPSSGWTALFFAVSKSRLGVAELLLKRGSNPLHLGNEGDSPLHVATENRAVELLLSHGANPNALDANLRHPLLRPVLVADYLSVLHLLRFGADAKLAHRAHVRRVQNELKLQEDESFVPVMELSDEPIESIDPVDWLVPQNREKFLAEYKAEQAMGLAKRSRLDLVRDLLNTGLVWLPWNTSVNGLFPENVRSAIYQLLLCRKRTDCALNRLPRDVFLHLCSFVATPSDDWRKLQGPKSWQWTKEFVERCWEYDVSDMMAAKVADCLQMGQCTKHLTGSDYMFQPFYKCNTCRWGDEFGNNLGMCRSCRDVCHKGHDTQVCGFLPAFCDCGDSARCQLDSQWSLLAKQEHNEPEMTVDGTKEMRYLIAVCDFHDPHILRELRRPENLLHAVPGDLIRADRRKLEEPGLMCEGELHGVTGVFPASRSYVIPMVEFVRALEDSPNSGDAKELRFKRGDLILPLGKWDGNAPEGFSQSSLLKGRLIRAEGDMLEGWFVDEAVDLVANYEIFCRDGENIKRKLCAMWSEGKELVQRTDLRALEIFATFRAEMRRLVPPGRETFKLALLTELAAIDMASLYQVLGRHREEQELLRDVIACTDPLCARPGGKNSSSSAAFFLRVRARSFLAMSLLRSGDVEEAFAQWKMLIAKEELERDKGLRVALIRLTAFTFLEIFSGAPNSLSHVLRLRSGIEEAKLTKDHELSRLCNGMMVHALLMKGLDQDAFKEKIEQLQVLESANRPLELLGELLDMGKLLLLRASNAVSAEQTLGRFLELYENHPEYHNVPEVMSWALECTALYAECLRNEGRYMTRAGGVVVRNVLKLDPETQKRFELSVLGKRLGAEVRVEGDEFVVRVGKKTDLAAPGKIVLLHRKGTLPDQKVDVVAEFLGQDGRREVLQEDVDESWKSVTFRLKAAGAGNVKIRWLSADGAVIGRVTFDLRAEEPKERKPEVEATKEGKEEDGEEAKKEEEETANDKKEKDESVVDQKIVESDEKKDEERKEKEEAN